MFQKIGLFGKYNGIQSWEVIEKLIQFLQNRNKNIYLDAVSCDGFPVERYGVKLYQQEQLFNEIDLAIVVGGDGTFLNVARLVVDKSIPLLGVNLGRLGFLTDISPAMMCQTMEEVFEGEYQTEQRNLLHLTVKDQGKQVYENVAFNDVVLHKNESPRMIEFETFIDGRFLNSQRSDGMIIATPTGSTAYSLSAGGPILDPSLDVLTLVSINPHTMSTRPVVVSGESTIRIQPHENCLGVASVICDGQVSYHISAQHETTVNRHKNFITMIHPKDHDHFKLLRAKLNWGQQLS